MERRVDYFGFELEREREAVHEFPPGMEEEARRVLADALARGAARHAAVQRNRQAVEELREAWRRSGGATRKLGQAELAAWYREGLRTVRNLQEFRAAALRLDPDVFVPRAERALLLGLPGAVEIRGRTVPMHYEVEENDGRPVGVVRLVMPEKVARGLVAEELPALDRPARFTVMRGARGAVKAESLDELQDALERPFTDDELRRETGAQHRDSSSARPWRAGDAGRGDRDRRDDRGGASYHGGVRSAGGGHDKGTHRPGSPAGRGKRRGKGL
jgi:hypothetical protein